MYSPNDFRYSSYLKNEISRDLPSSSRLQSEYSGIFKIYLHRRFYTFTLDQSDRNHFSSWPVKVLVSQMSLKRAQGARRRIFLHEARVANLLEHVGWRTTWYRRWKLTMIAMMMTMIAHPIPMRTRMNTQTRMSVRRPTSTIMMGMKNREPIPPILTMAAASVRAMAKPPKATSVLIQTNWTRGINWTKAKRNMQPGSSVLIWLMINLTKPYWKRPLCRQIVS